MTTGRESARMTILFFMPDLQYRNFVCKIPVANKFRQNIQTHSQKHYTNPKNPQNETFYSLTYLKKNGIMNTWMHI